MLKAGFIGLAIALGFIILLALLSQMGLVMWGPCGPDPFGLVLLLGVLICGSVGILLTIMGFIQKCFRKFHDDGSSPAADDVSKEFQ
jgi:hypothetical protein